MKDNKQQDAGFLGALKAREVGVYQALEGVQGRDNVVEISICRLAELCGESEKDVTLGVINLFLKKLLTYELSPRLDQPSRFVLEHEHSRKSFEGEEGGYRGEKRENALRCVTQRNATLKNINNSSANATSVASVERCALDGPSGEGNSDARKDEEAAKPISSDRPSGAPASGDKATLSSTPTEQEDVEAENDEVFAAKVATGLAEPDKTGLYRWYLERFGRAAVLSAFCRAKEMPDKKLKSSRAALFTFLLKNSAKSKKT